MLMNSPYRNDNGIDYVKVTPQQLYFTQWLCDDFRLLTKEMTLAGLKTKEDKLEHLKLAIALSIEELRKTQRGDKNG